ncbi:MAG: DNA-3-methyladenine glycosylase I [Acidobacteriota bacterium]
MSTQDLKLGEDGRQRCGWVADDALYIAYHDEEWGVPVYDDRLLFEMLTLEGAQAGLSWRTILNKREGYRRLFANFDAERVARFDAARVDALLQDASIVRHRGKVESTVSNAACFIEVQETEGSFADYLWGFVHGKRKVNAFERLEDVPAKTDLSDRLSKDLKKRGFRFVGSTTCYAFLQAVGVVNDHLVGCFRYYEV